MFSLRRVVNPATNPVSLDEAKLHLAIDTTFTRFDLLISSHITAATTKIEQYTNRGLVTQTWELTLDSFPDRAVELPMAAPLDNITIVTYTLADGTIETIAVNRYISDAAKEPGRLVLNPDADWPSVDLYPSSAVKIRYVVGQPDTDVPSIYKAAILLYVGFLFEHRDASELKSNTLPDVVRDLLYSHRVHSPLPVVWGV